MRSVLHRKGFSNALLSFTISIPVKVTEPQEKSLTPWAPGVSFLENKWGGHVLPGEPQGPIPVHQADKFSAYSPSGL